MTNSLRHEACISSHVALDFGSGQKVPFHVIMRGATLVNKSSLPDYPTANMQGELPDIVTNIAVHEPKQVNPI
jgi:hypothetical protein